LGNLQQKAYLNFWLVKNSGDSQIYFVTIDNCGPFAILCITCNLISLKLGLISDDLKMFSEESICAIKIISADNDK